VRLLLKYDADPLITNEDRKRPEDITKSRTIVELLRTRPPEIIHVESKEKVKPPPVRFFCSLFFFSCLFFFFSFLFCCYCFSFHFSLMMFFIFTFSF